MITTVIMKNTLLTFFPEGTKLTIKTIIEHGSGCVSTPTNNPKSIDWRRTLYNGSLYLVEALCIDEPIEISQKIMKPSLTIKSVEKQIIEGDILNPLNFILGPRKIKSINKNRWNWLLSKNNKEFKSIVNIIIFYGSDENKMKELTNYNTETIIELKSVLGMELNIENINIFDSLIKFFNIG
jgi:hypothetical protein